jgi:chromosome segregation ATPase
MSKTNPQRFNSHATRGNASQTIARFVDSVEDLAVELDAPDRVISEFVDAGEEMAQLVQETAEQVEDNAEQVEDNADETEELHDRIDSVDEQHGSNIEGCHSRITTVEDEIDELEARKPREADSSVDEPQSVDGETTALERVCGLPEHVVEDNLTANQQRARSVARRIEEYGRKVPAGVAITSSRIKRVLTAQEDTTIHRQTVSRVADFLERFGDGAVQIKETKGGKTTVVFDEQLVDAVTGVVTEQEASSVTPTAV